MDGQLRERLGQLEQAVAEVGGYCRAQKDVPSAQGQPWGTREVLAHILFWHERTCINAERVLAGQAPEAAAGHTDEVNAAAIDRRQGQSMAQMVDDLNTLQQRLSANYQQLKDMNAIVMVRTDGTAYTAMQRLEVMTRHFKGHLTELREG